ncbi:phosphotransferase [Allokutzneria oryzae]|uniref:Phosphotransferase n=1 Tax=Allokutzneria oryzae TaxID=1378989 RepID=A0ABV6A153_9PSEU
MTELPLQGGSITGPVRVGDTVRRATGPHAAFVHQVLGHFERHGWTGAPRFLGVDDKGREILTFVEGHIAWRSRDGVDSVESLEAVARLVREFHDLTAGTPLAGDQEVLCHNDLAPKNTVYRESLPIAFLDWDLAAPGARVHDVAHVCWQYLDLGPGVTDPPETARRFRAICDAYGLADRAHVVDTVLWWQDRCARGIEAGADAGDPAMSRLRAAGAVESVREAHEWVARHRHWVA